MVIVLILLICVAVSNPIKETHQKKLISKFNEEHPILGVLQGGDVLSNLVEYENYVFFSKTKNLDHPRERHPKTLWASRRFSPECKCQWIWTILGGSRVVR